MMSTSSPPSTGFGLMRFTWRPGGSIPDDRAFPIMKAAADNGATIWSSSPVYGTSPEPPTAGLQLLCRFFEKYPDYASKVTLFIRGCFDAKTFQPRCTRDGIRASWQEAEDILGAVKTIDVFGPARMDQNVPVEETIGALKELVEEGKIGAVGLSEVRAETIRKAAAVCPIAFSEVEFSLWCTEMLENGVAQAAKDCNIVLLPYSPLGGGFLTGRIKSLEDIPEGDGRRLLDRFLPENFDKNLELVEQIKAFAEKQGVTPAQLALAWVRSYSNTGTCGTIIPIPGATTVESANENCSAVEISPQVKAALDGILKTFEVRGKRGRTGAEHFLLT